jgi:hypothetical protein
MNGSRFVFPLLVTAVTLGAMYLIFWTASHGRLIESAALALFMICVLLSHTRRYAQSQIKVFDLRPPRDDEPEL